MQLVNVYYVPDAVVDPGDAVIIPTHRTPILKELNSSGATDNP